MSRVLEGLSKERFPDVHPDLTSAVNDYVQSLSLRQRRKPTPTVLLGATSWKHFPGHCKDNTPLARATVIRLEEILLTPEEIEAARNNHERLPDTLAQHLRELAKVNQARLNH